MSSKKAIAAAVALAMEKARAGVDYSPRTGATCPCCGAEKLPVVTTRPWDGPLRTRFHRCESKSCLLYALKASIKSVEFDATQPPAGQEKAQNTHV